MEKIVTSAGLTSKAMVVISIDVNPDVGVVIRKQGHCGDIPMISTDALRRSTCSATLVLSLIIALLYLRSRAVSILLV